MLFVSAGTDYLFLTDIAFHDCGLVDCKVLENQELISLEISDASNQDILKKTYQMFHENGEIYRTMASTDSTRL